MSASPIATHSRGGPICKLLGAVLLVLGIALATAGITQTVHKVSGAIVDTFNGPILTVPFDTSVPVHEAGTYEVLQDTAYPNNSGSSSYAAVQPSDVSLIGPDGRSVQLVATAGRTTISRDSADFFDILKFKADQPGDYRMSIAEPTGLRLIVTPSFGETFGRAARWIGIGMLGGISGLAGLVLLIVGFYLAHKAKNPQPTLPAYAAGPGSSRPPPPGWYPDPGRPGATLWWDGTRWHQ